MDVPHCIQLDIPAQLTQKSDRTSLGSLDVKFAWMSSDPFALTMTFQEKGDPVTWYAGADLFLNAIADDNHGWHGEGDISVRFFSDTSAQIDLRGDHDRPAVIAEVYATELASFVNRISRLRVLHAEYIAWLIKKELDELLEAA